MAGQGPVGEGGAGGAGGAANSAECPNAADAQPVGFASEERWYLARPADATGACTSGGAADQAIVYGGHDE